jgi:hypothetical protein
MCLTPTLNERILFLRSRGRQTWTARESGSPGSVSALRIRRKNGGPAFNACYSRRWRPPSHSGSCRRLRDPPTHALTTTPDPEWRYACTAPLLSKLAARRPGLRLIKPDASVPWIERASKISVVPILRSAGLVQRGEEIVPSHFDHFRLPLYLHTLAKTPHDVKRSFSKSGGPVGRALSFCA